MQQVEPAAGGGGHVGGVVVPASAIAALGAVEGDVGRLQQVDASLPLASSRRVRPIVAGSAANIRRRRRAAEMIHQLHRVECVVRPEQTEDVATATRASVIFGSSGHSSVARPQAAAGRPSEPKGVIEFRKVV